MTSAELKNKIGNEPPIHAPIKTDLPTRAQQKGLDDTQRENPYDGDSKFLVAQNGPVKGTPNTNPEEILTGEDLKKVTRAVDSIVIGMKISEDIKGLNLDQLAALKDLVTKATSSAGTTEALPEGLRHLVTKHSNDKSLIRSAYFDRIMERSEALATNDRLHKILTAAGPETVKSARAQAIASIQAGNTNSQSKIELFDKITDSLGKKTAEAITREVNSVAKDAISRWRVKENFVNHLSDLPIK